jgi:predicted thioesterase
MTIAPGLEANLERTVTEEDTARAQGSGDVEVIGTPVIVALCEAVAVKALEGALGENETSVGVFIEIQHTAATPPGNFLVVHAKLMEVEGNKLTFAISASDRGGSVAHGRHQRVIVDRNRFLKGARGRR